MSLGRITLKAIDSQLIPALKDCVHCGLCLPECPTYRATGREAESPRGRIAALRAVAEERSGISDAIHDGLESCLVCRACESACPSGISMENLMASYRQEARKDRSDLPARIESFMLEEVISSPQRLDLLLGALGLVAPLMRWIPQASDLPACHRLRRGPQLPPVIEAKGSRRGTVSILRGCVADRLFREETLLSARLLALHGWRVLIPAAGCCGALHHHAGKIEESHRLSDERWRELSSGNVDHVIVDSAGCAAHLHARNDSSGPEVLDTATLLARTGNFETTQKLPGKSVVSSPCHQQHSAISYQDGASLIEKCLDQRVELPAPDHCCGAAGMYLLRRRKMSQEIGKESRERFDLSGADQLVSGNPGCLLRWEAMLDIGAVLHPVRVLAHACGLEQLPGKRKTNIA